MAKDREGQKPPQHIAKEGWLSLQNGQSLARPVRGVLTDSSFDLYAAHPKRLVSDPFSKSSSGLSSNTLADAPFGARNASLTSLSGQGMNVTYKSVETPHPGASDPLNCEAVAHDLLFNPQEAKSYEAVILTFNVLEVANSLGAYVELLLNKSLAGAASGNPPALKSSIPTRIFKYCQAVLSFPSIVLNTSALASVARLVSSLGCLDAQLAEQIKLYISKAQENAQKRLQRCFTPNVEPASLATPPTSPPISDSPWATKLLKLTEKGEKLPASMMLEPGFANEFADQIAAFHRRMWKYWPPTSDLSLLFHAPQSYSSWKINPLVFDLESPHFLGSLVTYHILNTEISDSYRAKLMEKWILVSERLRSQGDSVGWAAILLVLFDPTVLRLFSTWSKVDRTLFARLASGWGYESFEVSKRARIPFLQKRAFRTNTEDMGKRISVHDCVPYFGDAIIHDHGDADIALKQLERLEAIISGWNAYVNSLPDDIPSIQVKEDPAHQCLFAVWAQQQPSAAILDRTALSLSVQPKLLGHYLASFYQQVLPLTSGAMIPVLFTTAVPNFRLFPRSTLILASQPKQPNKPRNTLRRSSSFPPAGPPQTTGVSELDTGAREQLENTASAHVLGQVVRDLLNVGTETIDAHSGIVFKTFPEENNIDSRSSRTSSIIETLNKRRSYPGRHVVVKSASMVRLVDVLVLGAGIFGNDLILDTETHIATLLATYRSFCSPAEMLDMLQVRVRCARGAARVLNEQFQINGSYSGWKQIWQVSEDDDRTDGFAVRIISMIITMLQKWISDYFFDFMDDKFVLDAGSTLLSALRHEISIGSYPEPMILQFGLVTGAFSRHQFSIDRREQHTPSWLQYVFDRERQSAYRQSQAVPPELPVTNLEHDGGLEQINEMIDELDTIVADAFNRISMLDWMKLFEVLELQTATRSGLFSYGAYTHSNESEFVVQNVFSWLATLQSPNSRTRVLDTLPESIVALVRLHCGLVSYFAAQVADPSLAHAHERRERMAFILKMLGVLRSRMKFFNLGSDFEDQEGQHIPSFLERAIVSSILVPESRAYATSWQIAGSEVALKFPSSQIPISMHGNNDTVPNSRTIFIPSVPTRQGRPVTVCVGWIAERLLEIVCCVPNTSVEHPDLINFDKRRYAYNLIKNMSSEFQSLGPNDTPSEIIAKYFFLFGEPARNAVVPIPLIDRKSHKESLIREGKSKTRVFVDILAQEQDKVKAESRMLEKIERMASAVAGVPGSQSFYGLPVSQSSTSLYSKRISRLIPSTSTVDVASILDGTSSHGQASSTQPASNGTAAAMPSASTSPSKRLPTHSKKSRFGGLFRAVRPLSVLGNAASTSNNNLPGPMAPHSPQSSLYAHQVGSSSSLHSNNAEESNSHDNPWLPDDSIDLALKPSLSEFTNEDWVPVQHLDLVTFSNVQMVSPMIVSISHRGGPKLESLLLRAPSPEEALEWFDLTSSLMRQKLLESGRVFGVPLDIVCHRENRDVPAFLEALLGQIEDRGLDEVGIYRISGSLASVNSIKQWFDQGNTACKQNDSRWSDINAIAGCIKLYLRELPQPLMTDRLLPEFMSVIGPSGVDVDMLRTVIRKLPVPNYYVLDRITHHLKLIVDHSAQNKMNVQNIAIVFSVNFLPPVAMSQMGGMQQLVSTLVLRHKEVFDH